MECLAVLLGVEVPGAPPTVQVLDERLTHLRFAGGHDLTEERFEAVVGWVLEQAG